MDRRRFPRYAGIRNLPFDVVSTWDDHEIIILSPADCVAIIPCGAVRDHLLLSSHLCMAATEFVRVVWSQMRACVHPAAQIYATETPSGFSLWQWR